MGFCLFVLPKRRRDVQDGCPRSPGGLPWRNRLFGTPSCPAAPRRAPPRRAPPRRDPPVVCSCFGLDKLGLHRISFVRASETNVQDVCFRCPGWQGGWLYPGRTNPPVSLPAPPRLALPRRRAPLCPAPPVVHPGFGFYKFPDIPRMKKFYKKQNCAGPWVSSQERRGLVVLFINRSSTARQSLVVFPHRFTQDFVCPCFRGDGRPGQVSSVPWKARQTLFFSPGRIVPPPSWAHPPAAIPSHPAAPRRAPPRPLCPPPASPLCAAAPRPARGMSGFGPDRLMVARYIFPGHALHEKGLQFPDILGMRRVCRDKKASIY